VATAVSAPAPLPPDSGKESVVTRLFSLVSLGLLSLLLVTQARAAEELTGVWRQETEGVGVSFWELTPKGEHTYEAQEYGLGGVKGMAHLKDGVLVIHFVNGDDKGTYEWRLKGTAGKGKLVLKLAGQDEKVFDNSSVRFIGK
jgi:hypothetical protein